MKLNKSTAIKLVIPLFFALAVGLGLVEYRQNLFGSKTTVSHFSNQSADSLAGYYQKSQSLAAQQNPNQTASFLAVGDIMLSRNVAAAIQKAKDFELPFRPLADVLKSTNFNFGNLESPVSATDPIIGGHTLIFASPSDYLTALKTYNFQIMNLANNHAFDGGLAGINATNQSLDSLGILHEGTGDTQDEAWRPAVVSANGIKICFVGASYASANDGGKTKNNYVARIEDVSRLKTAITIARSECDFTVATMHAGKEYTRGPNKAQMAFAHAAVDYGADIVIGAHPHWVQTIEKYCPLQSSPPFQGGVAASADGVVGTLSKSIPTTSPASQGLLLKKEESSAVCPNPKYIFYSLGNFIFDQEWSQETKEGLALKITATQSGVPNPQTPGAASVDDLQGGRTGAKLVSIELIPVIVENYSTPRLASPDESKKILQKIGQTENILYP